METWKSVVGYEGLYEVSDLGRVRSLDRPRWAGKSWCMVRGKLLKHGTMKNGYLFFHLHSGGPVAGRGASKTYLAHRLVLISFVSKAPAGEEACHKNGIRSDNRLLNLRWDTRSQNHLDKRVHGTDHGGERNPRAKLSSTDVERVFDLRACGCSITEAAEWIGVSPTTVHDIIVGKTWKHVPRPARA